MHILERKGSGRTFLCVKADRDSLYSADIINSTALIKIRKGDMRCSLSIRTGVIGVGIF